MAWSVLFTLTIAWHSADAKVARVDAPTQADVFVAGTEGFHTFRIPAIIATKSGTLLAFAEGRRKSASDTGDIDLVLRRSTDGGKTWGELKVIHDDGENTIGNPCPVIDRDTGVVWLLLTGNLGKENEAAISKGASKLSRRVYVSKSDDDGVTWSPRKDVTASTKAPNWTWYATGPGNGIQMAGGRMVIPCDHNVLPSNTRRSHVIYSDDHGENWVRGGVVGDHTNECQVVALGPETLLINMRSYAGKNLRAVATSSDKGISWSPVQLHPELIEPVCQASLISIPDAETSNPILLFSNPASTKRDTLTVRASFDLGASWPFSKVLESGPSAYSSLVSLPGGEIGCLYERGDKRPYDAIRLSRFNLAWITSGQASVPKGP
ncbi:MAG: sialidase family protein [Planctomycetota bacterium]